MTPYIGLSDESRSILEKLRLQDIDLLIKKYQYLEAFELAFLILLGLFLLGYLLYLIVKLFKKRYIRSTEWIIKRKLDSVNQIQGQPEFLKEAENLIRMILRDRFNFDEQGLTDLELYAFFRGTPLQQESEQTLSLIDQGRFGKIQLQQKEKEKIAHFLANLYSVKSI